MNSIAPATSPVKGDTTYLDAALGYAARGWRVAPLHSVDVRGCSCGKSECSSPGKHPRTKNGLTDGTTDEDTIRGWWLKWPRANVAVVCGRESGVWVVGPDGEQGIADFERLQAERGEIVKPLAISRTQGGGRHLLFTWPTDGEAIKNRKNHRGTKIDVRAEGEMGPGYIVAPPSIGPKGRYEWLIAPEAGEHLASPWVVEWARTDEVKERPAEPTLRPMPTPTEPDRAAVHKRAVGYLNTIPDAVQGEGGSDPTFWAARVLVHGYRLDQNEAYALLATFFNPRCKPKWSEKELRYKVKEAAERPFNKPKGWLLDAANPYAEFPMPRANPAADPAAMVAPAVWPEPIPLRAPLDAPAFPLDVFPMWLGEFCDSVAAQANVPVGYVAANVLGVAAGAIGATLTLALTPEWVERACLFVAVVAPKSAGKTPAHLAAMKPLRRLQAERGKREDKLVLFTTDTTVEAIAPLLRDRPRGLLVAADELSGFVGGMNQYKPGGKGGDRAFWLSCWAGSTISVLRRNPDAPHLWVPHPCVSVLGGVQPAVLADVFGTDDGFAERFLFECSDPLPAGRATRGDYRCDDIWKETVKQLAALEMARDEEYGTRPHKVGLTEDGWEVFADWTAACMGGVDRDPALDGFRSKGRGYAARLALVLHVLTRFKPGEAMPHVDAAGMADGVKLMRYYLAQVERVRAGAGASPSDAERVLRWLSGCGLATVTRRDVHRGMHRQFSRADMLAEPLRILVQHGWLRYAESGPTGGRRCEAVYELRPDLCQRCQHPSGDGGDTLTRVPSRT